MQTERRENLLPYFECFFTNKLFVYLRKNALPGNKQNLWASGREMMSYDKEYEAKEIFSPLQIRLKCVTLMLFFQFILIELAL